MSTRLARVNDFAGDFGSIPPDAPATLGRYQILSRLGRGGMGTVYLARLIGEGGFSRYTAIKVLRSHLSRDDAAMRMLLREAKIAGQVLHPNVVSVLDVGMQEGQPYLVMDYVHGVSLAKLLKTGAAGATTNAAVSIIIDCLAGLQAIHVLKDEKGKSLGIVHNDVSPENFIVGVDGVARVSDFGVAYIRSALEGNDGRNRGKPAYFSPERIRGARVDHRSDVFSVGVTLWTALTGVQLFDAPTTEQTIEKVLREPVRPPSEVGRRPPRCFDAICLMALERDPNNRFQSAEEMLVELRRIAAVQNRLASPTEVSNWVRTTISKDADSNRPRLAEPPPAAPRPIVRQSSKPPPDPIISFSEQPAADSEPPPPSSRAVETVDLGSDLQARSKRTLKWAAAAIAAIILVIAIAAPGLFSAPPPTSVVPKERSPSAAANPKPQAKPATTTTGPPVQADAGSNTPDAAANAADHHHVQNPKPPAAPRHVYRRPARRSSRVTRQAPATPPPATAPAPTVSPVPSASQETSSTGDAGIGPLVPPAAPGAPNDSADDDPYGI